MPCPPYSPSTLRDGSFSQARPSVAAYLERGVRVALVVWLTGYGGTGCVVDKVRWYGMYGGIGGSVVMVVRVVRCGTGGPGGMDIARSPVDHRIPRSSSTRRPPPEVATRRRRPPGRAPAAGPHRLQSSPRLRSVNSTIMLGSPLCHPNTFPLLQREYIA